MQAQDFVFAQLTGSPINTVGWNLQGAATVGDIPGGTGNRDLILTSPINFTSGAVFFNTPINLAQCKRWVAEFEFRMFDGSAADGLAFCYLDVPPAGFVSGGGVGIPATANGLKVVLDTWRNCGTDQVPKIQLRWGPGYTECNNQPTRNNNDNALNFIRSDNYNRCRIEYNEGNIRVLLNGVEYLTGFQTFDFTGYFGFTASTGGSNDSHSLRNVRIFTEMPPSNAGLRETSFCTGGSAQLGVTANPAYVYQWNPISGLSDPSTSNPVVSLQNDGPNDVEVTYVVQTAFADRPGCGSRDSVRIKVLANPVPSFQHDTNCISEPLIAFTNTTTRNGVVQSDMQYRWNFGDPSGGVGNEQTVINPQYRFSGANNYTVTLQATSIEGCSASITRNITPLAAPPQVSLRWLGDTCSNYQISFLPDVNQNGSFPLTYAWAFGDGQTSTLPAPVHTFRAGGTYTIALEVANPYCPPVSFSQPITIKPSPELAIADTTGPHCLNVSEVIIPNPRVVNSIAGSGTFSGPGIRDGLFIPGLAGLGTHQVQYIFVGDNGCNDTLSIAQQVLELPEVNAGPDRISLEATPIQLEGATGTVSSFAWEPPLFLSDPSILNPVANPPVNQQYVLRGTLANGCVATDTMLVTVLPSIFIPNAFSPNGDGINDVWLIRNLDAYPGTEIKIFDRYGQIVFSSIGTAQPWNGTSKSGVPVPSGVYYYIIDPKNGVSLRQGSVTVLR